MWLIVLEAYLSVAHQQLSAIGFLAIVEAIMRPITGRTGHCAGVYPRMIVITSGYKITLRLIGVRMGLGCAAATATDT